jgi:hypothetical protein
MTFFTLLHSLCVKLDLVDLLMGGDECDLRLPNGLEAASPFGIGWCTRAPNEGV